MSLIGDKTAYFSGFTHS